MTARFMESAQQVNGITITNNNPTPRIAGTQLFILPVDRFKVMHIPIVMGRVFYPILSKSTS